jgi:hypothetical protein
MNTRDEDRMKKLLREALPPIESEPGPGRDLWPKVLERLDAGSAAVPWFDWALMAGLAGIAISFPAAIPVILYYL